MDGRSESGFKLPGSVTETGSGDSAIEESGRRQIFGKENREGQRVKWGRRDRDRDRDRD